ncbi:MAG: ABC transporter ATP-binding protein [Desulfarculus sp.]|nr:ABC transporter ATP-binding protein [Desulfarculus sp.]
MILEVKGLQAYYGKSHVLQGVDLELEQGQLVCLLGRNGVGKSTTLMTIMGLVPPAGGSVRFKGQELAGRQPFEIARLGLGFVPEERRIFSSLSVLENLEIGRQKARPGQQGQGWTVERILDSFPRLAERRGNRGCHLSGGEQQMLTIARTLMGNPEVVLVDEPTEGLAPLVAEGVLEMLSTISLAGVTILLVEQNLKAAMKLANAFYVMSKGRMVFKGDAAELTAAEEVRRKYLEV